MIPYDESRKYGKKVLANYYIYANYFGIKTTIQDLFREVSQRKK
jgi:soluble lytic murein transglycosylase